MFNVVIPASMAKIQKQIEVLEYLIANDSDAKSKEIHSQALDAMKECLKALQAVEDAPSPGGRKKTVDVGLIRKLRSEGKTQEQTAQAMGISVSTVKRNEI